MSAVLQAILAGGMLLALVGYAYKLITTKGQR